jgi:hypothetical protein
LAIFIARDKAPAELMADREFAELTILHEQVSHMHTEFVRRVAAGDLSIDRVTYHTRLRQLEARAKASLERNPADTRFQKFLGYVTEIKRLNEF